MRNEIIQGFRFEAAHRLPNVGPFHRCRRMHGHSYRIDIHVEGETDPATGWVVDFFDIEKAFAPVMEELDHHILNEVPGLENPTAEHISAWIWGKMKPVLPGLSQVVVHETELARAIYRGE